jgi:hypothetical protein
MSVVASASFATIFNEAHLEGLAAGSAHAPRPMTVLDSNGTLYGPYSDGVCGFAWVNFAGNTPFGRWAKKTGRARPDYPTGLCVWVGEFNQSMEKKEAYAHAFARILNKYGIVAHARSRMD